jgi:hypothetical protein
MTLSEEIASQHSRPDGRIIGVRPGFRGESLVERECGQPCEGFAQGAYQHARGCHGLAAS